MDKEAVLQFVFELNPDGLRAVGNLVRFADRRVRFEEREAIHKIYFEGVFPLQITHAAKRHAFRCSKRNFERI